MKQKTLYIIIGILFLGLLIIGGYVLDEKVIRPKLNEKQREINNTLISAYNNGSFNTINLLIEMEIYPIELINNSIIKWKNKSGLCEE